MIRTPYALHPEPVKRSWIEQHPLWKIPLGLLLLAFLIAIGGTILVFVIMASFRSSDVYKEALARASASTQVHERMGEPIQPGWFVSGQLNASGGTGTANLAIPIAGPRSKGLIRAVASKSGAWRFSCLRVEIRGQPGIIDLLSVQPPAEREF
jgi:hypothetical protein